MSDLYPTLFGIGIVLIALVTGVVRAYQSREQTRKADEAIEEAESRIEEEPEKAKPTWDLARVTLESYFNRNLSQVSSIFWLSVFVMMIGFAVIVFGIFEAVKKTPAVGAAAIATGAGIITEFIEATFLFIYRSTIQQAIGYTKTLERINSVGMAMQILDTMPDNTPPDDLKSKTKARLVELLVGRVHTIREQQAALLRTASHKATGVQTRDEDEL